MIQSEVARLKEQIRLEYEAARRGLTGLSLGTSYHQFITARTEKLGKIHEQLTALIGEDEAMKMIVEVFDRGEEMTGGESYASV
jgi:hypothetical protein